MPSRAKRDKERRWKLARNAVWDCVPARLGSEVPATWASRGTGAGRAGPVRGAVCSCATIVGGSPRGILDLMRGRGRGSLGVVDGTS